MEILGKQTKPRRNKTTKKKGNGQGTLYYSSALKKLVGQYVGPSGSRKTLTQKKGEGNKAFKDRFNDTLYSIRNGTYIENKNVSLYDIISDYIDVKYHTGITSPRTHKRNTETLKLLKLCCQNFINKPIQKVTIFEIKKALPNMVELEFIDKKTKEKYTRLYSQNVIDKEFALLKKGFKIATSERLILYNIIENESIHKPKSKQKTEKVEALTVEEEKKLIDVLRNCNHKYKNIILLCLSTGLRIGETLGITKDNVNLKENTLTVQRSLTRDKNDKVILGDTTKTKAGSRTIYLSQNANKILKDVLNCNISNMYNLLFFDYTNNTFISPNEINCYLQRLNHKEKFCKHIHTHMLRHTYATRCIEAGMSAKVLQKNLGHTKIQTTLDTYTSVFEKFNTNENEKYDNYMKNLEI